MLNLFPVFSNFCVRKTRPVLAKHCSLSSRRIPPLNKNWCVCVCVCVYSLKAFSVFHFHFLLLSQAFAPHRTVRAQLRHTAPHINLSLLFHCHIEWYIFGLAISLYVSIFLYFSTVILLFCPNLLSALYNSHIQ